MTTRHRLQNNIGMENNKVPSSINSKLKKEFLKEQKEEERSSMKLLDDKKIILILEIIITFIIIIITIILCFMLKAVYITVIVLHIISLIIISSHIILNQSADQTYILFIYIWLYWIISSFLWSFTTHSFINPMIEIIISICFYIFIGIINISDLYKYVKITLVIYIFITSIFISFPIHENNLFYSPLNSIIIMILYSTNFFITRYYFTNHRNSDESSRELIYYLLKLYIFNIYIFYINLYFTIILFLVINTTMIIIMIKKKYKNPKSNKKYLLKKIELPVSIDKNNQNLIKKQIKQHISKKNNISNNINKKKIIKYQNIIDPVSINNTNLPSLQYFYE